jgi:homoserine kinase
LTGTPPQSGRVVVRAPATSANLGPGFDCLGLALDLWNDAQATPGPQPGADDNLILRAAERVFDEVGARYPGFVLDCHNRVPFSRGLGSSAAAIVSGILFANAWLGSPLDESACLRLATQLEGHPDNVVPCLLGGVRVAACDAGGQIVQAEVPLTLALSAVVFVPDHRLATLDARGRLPATVPLADALFNVARSSLFVAALASGRADLLRAATRDRLHQPYRLPLFPAGATLISSALAAGALGACMSGAGPTVLALCSNPMMQQAVERAFEHTARELGVPGASLCLALSPRGAHVVSA